MKKLVAFFLALALFFGIIVPANSASAMGQSLRLPSGLTAIEEEAFMNDTSLGDVFIPSDVKTIGKRAFYGSSVKSVNLPDSVSAVGEEAFADAASLVEVNAPDLVLSRINLNSVFAGTPWLRMLEAQPVSTGENSVQIPAGETVLCKYIVPRSATYVLYSVGDSNTYGYLYDDCLNELTSDDDGGEGSNFRISFDLEAGQTVYIEFGYFNHETGGTETLVIEESEGQFFVGTNAVAVPAGEIVYGRFTAQSAGTYTFYSANEEDTLGYLYNENMVELASDDDGGENRNFKMTYHLTAGETVIVGVKYYYDSISGTISLMIDEENIMVPLRSGRNQVEFTSETATFGVYTAGEAGVYTFYTEGENDTWGILHDANNTRLAVDDDSGEKYNFKIEYAMTAGQTVFIEVGYSVESVSGTETLVIREPEKVFTDGINTVSIFRGREAIGKYVADQAGQYIFCTDGEYDTVGYLYDENLNLLASSDDDGNGRNFMIKYDLEAGQIVYVGVQYYSDTVAGSEDLLITFSEYRFKVGDNPVQIPADQIAWGLFTAKLDGDYVFSTSGIQDTYGCIFDEDGEKELASDDNSGDGANFSIRYHLNAGQSVHVGVLYMQSGVSGTVNLNIVNGAAYRALLIGQQSFPGDTCTRNAGDVEMMSSLLQTVNNGQYAISGVIDLTKNEVRNAIRTTFADADEDDVSLFLYSSHGVTNAGYYYGALSTYNNEHILTSELASWLSEVPGKVIVLIGTCGSGAAIEEQSNGVKAANAFDPDLLSESIISAFAAYDASPNSGELRTSKFYVMTAAMGGELSWGNEGLHYNYFAKWLYDGAGGTAVVMPADTNTDGELTLAEWYTYVNDRAAVKEFKDGAKQHPMVYPVNSDYVIFTK